MQLIDSGFPDGPEIWVVFRFLWNIAMHMDEVAAPAV